MVTEPDVSGPAVLIELAAVKSAATLICPAFNRPVTETLPAVKPPLIEALAKFTAPVWKEPACRAPVTDSVLAVTAPVELTDGACRCPASDVAPAVRPPVALTDAAVKAPAALSELPMFTWRPVVSEPTTVTVLAVSALATEADAAVKPPATLIDAAEMPLVTESTFVVSVPELLMLLEDTRPEIAAAFAVMAPTEETAAVVTIPAALTEPEAKIELPATIPCMAVKPAFTIREVAAVIAPTELKVPATT